ncbi:DUF4829 domain-containing protein [Clostridium sp. DSM 100503]|uniref:DUF4829 domain-containing protein n=1 Tax=Clostridium sp. DSM 100503 TaxID=2963282 RepID=UPI00214A0E76|nr:DUF4829 domain-containing protein [Clostridium sp. DSM 100503]MCR1952726.1 DUF4829 domain-containing protein [Clostridium sp. DSM 100503]
MFSLVSCKQGRISDNIEIDISESTKFSKDEITNSIECVKSNFNFEGATLTKIWYDEKKSNNLVDIYLENGNGSQNGVSEEDVIILLSNFYVDDSGKNPVLNRDTIYTDYQWILIRDNEKSEWKIDSFGF